VKRIVVGGIIAGAVSVFILMDALGGYVSTLSLIVFGLFWYSLSATLIVSGVRVNRRNKEVLTKNDTIVRGGTQ